MKEGNHKIALESESWQQAKVGKEDVMSSIEDLIRRLELIRVMLLSF